MSNVDSTLTLLSPAVKLQRFSQSGPAVGSRQSLAVPGVRIIRWSAGEYQSSFHHFITSRSSSSRGELKMTNKPMEDEDHHHQNDIDHLLLTVLLPSFPPNRSQWKKLEHALNFINKSRSSSSDEKRKYFQNKTERGRMTGTESYQLQSGRGLDARQDSVPCTPSTS